MPEIVRLVKIEDEMRGSYLDYAMSVIVSRALPDARDGLKPVQRRVLFAMNEMGLQPNTAYRKSARIVGEVLGKYHPHGDSSVYEAMVRMAQDFSLRYPLVDGQGNFGSIDNDPPAAMRYTEAKLAPIATEILVDIDRNTVDFAPNFDDSLKEPVVLPARLPNLLLNGASGIAVGMATNIPPHNLGELCEGIVHLIDNPEAPPEELLRLVHGPDFPTAGIILGREGIASAYATGRGRIVLRARSHIEEQARGGRFQIVVTELPYQVNKATLLERIAELVKEKKVEAISELRDESDRHGMRMVIELRREAKPQRILSTLYKHTALQTAFNVNMLALVNGAPRVLTLKTALVHYIVHRREVTRRRAEFDLQKARERAHILEGLKIALDNLDAIITLIRRSQNAETARGNLVREFKLTVVQAQAILDMQLRRLAALERKRILDEYTEVLKAIGELEDLLANPKKIDFLIRGEVVTLKQKYGDARRTRISDDSGDISEEDLIPDQDVVVTISKRGYVKRVAADTYRSQRRGGRGITGMVTRETDAVRHLLVGNTRDWVLFFTNRGRAFSLRCAELPDASRQARGLPLVNLMSIDPKERITALVHVPSFEGASFLLLATRLGEVKKCSLDFFAAVRSSGIIAMDLEASDELVGACLAQPGDHIMMVSEQGQATRFTEKELRKASRTSGGVRGMRLDPGDFVAAQVPVRPGCHLLVVTSDGLGKRTPFDEYPLRGRGGSGVMTLKTAGKAGRIVAARDVGPGEELMLISTEGIVIRTPVDTIPTKSRITQGVHVMRLEASDSVAAIACFDANPTPGKQLELLDAGGELPSGDQAPPPRGGPGATPAPKRTSRGKRGAG